MPWVIGGNGVFVFGGVSDFLVGKVGRLWKGCAWVVYLFGKGGAMWASPPTIPPALRATSLFKGGLRANDVRPYGEWGFTL